MRIVAPLVVAVVWLLCAGDVVARDLPDPRQRHAVPIAGAPVIGAADALVTIVEFSDFYCAYCRRANTIVADLLRLYPDQLRVVYRHSLLDPREGTLAAEASMAAAAQGKFWPFHDRLFAATAPTEIEGVVQLAAELGLELVTFRRDMVSRRHLGVIAADDELARSLKVDGLPMFFVNGRPLSGAQPFGVFVKLVEEEIELAGKMLRDGTPPGGLYAALIGRGDQDQSELSGAEELYRVGVDPARIRAVGLGRETHRRGGAEPLVTIVEFSDFDCNYCARANPMLAAVLREYGDDIRQVFRHFPLGGTTKLVAEAAEAAAAQGRFWEFHDRVFEERATEPGDLVRQATALGLDAVAFERALSERRYARRVARDAAAGAALGVTGTPTFFINGRAVVGAPPPEALRKLIDEEIAAARLLLKDGVPRAEIYERLTARESAPVTDTGGQDRIEIDPVDYHIAVLLACRENDRETALRFYEKVEDSKRRVLIRSDCKRLGIDLPR